MARIAGVNIPDKQHIVVGLTSVYGIGRSRARKICKDAGIVPSKKVQELSEAELEKLRAEVTNYKVEGDLRREVSLNIKTLIELGTYRGIRHRR